MRDDFRRLFRGANDIIVVYSHGGQIGYALDIAESIQESGNLLVVDEVCLSACANWLFIAASQKIVAAGGLVGWHGGPPDPNQPNLGGNSNGEPWNGDARFFSRSQAVLERAGVNPGLIYGLNAVGQGGVELHYRVPDAETLRQAYQVSGILFYDKSTVTEAWGAPRGNSHRDSP